VPRRVKPGAITRERRRPGCQWHPGLRVPRRWL